MSARQAYGSTIVEANTKEWRRFNVLLAITTTPCQHGHATEWEDEAPAAQKARAIRLCQGCPIRTACLDAADSTQEPAGIWGGYTPKQRTRRRNQQTQHPSHGHAA